MTWPVFTQRHGLRVVVGWVARGYIGPRWRALTPDGKLGWFEKRDDAEAWLTEMYPV